MVAIRKDLSSLAGLGTFPNREPSHKWLGYFQGRRRDAENGYRDGRAPRQSPSWWPCALVAVCKDPANGSLGWTNAGKGRLKSFRAKNAKVAKSVGLESL